MTDSNQLEHHVTAGITVDIESPRIKAHADDTGTVALFIGPLLLTFQPADAAALAASLASVAATAMVNKTYAALRSVTQ